MLSLVWGAVAVAALWWPGTTSGPLDGAPLDGNLEAVALGLIRPALWWCHSDFLQSRLARVAITAILLIKLSGVLLVQDRWCVRFDTAAPIVSGSTGRIHSSWRTPGAFRQF